MVQHAGHHENNTTWWVCILSYRETHPTHPTLLSGEEELEGLPSRQATLLPMDFPRMALQLHFLETAPWLAVSHLTNMSWSRVSGSIIIPKVENKNV